MEEWVGEQWHRFITRVADTSFMPKAVELAEVQPLVESRFEHAARALVPVADAAMSLSTTSTSVASASSSCSKARWTRSTPSNPAAVKPKGCPPDSPNSTR